MTDSNDEAEVATDAFQSFAKEWGDMNILYNRIVLEEFLKELLGVEDGGKDD